MPSFDPLAEEIKRILEEYAKYPLERQMLPTEGHRYGAKYIVPGARVPVVDVEETEKEVVARIELPGVTKREIQLVVKDDSVEVKVERKEVIKSEKQGFILFERAYANFYRRFAIPANVIPDKTKAVCENGVLTVTMLKGEDNKKTKHVSIN